VRTLSLHPLQVLAPGHCAKRHRSVPPLVAPIILIRHYVRRFAEPSLARQAWLRSHPVELALRNHV
jgi:uncharacterized protein YbgA (DUF1722 family)